ncbi:MAG: nucleoside 2-deoxyribosyltransferase domain-containing protein [Magnetococcus sp. DMHC-1]
MKIYLASSWRNQYYDKVISAIRRLKDVSVYDFKQQQFTKWTLLGELAKDQAVCTREFDRELETERTRDAFETDYKALNNADVVVLVLPCGISAHMEAAYAAGQGKTVFIWTNGMIIPELMYGILLKRGTLMSDKNMELFLGTQKTLIQLTSNHKNNKSCAACKHYYIKKFGDYRSPYCNESVVMDPELCGKFQLRNSKSRK